MSWLMASPRRPCWRGRIAAPRRVTVDTRSAGVGPPDALLFAPQAVAADPAACLALIRAKVDRRGGVAPLKRQVRA